MSTSSGRMSTKMTSVNRGQEARRGRRASRRPRAAPARTRRSAAPPTCPGGSSAGRTASSPRGRRASGTNRASAGRRRRAGASTPRGRADIADGTGRDRGGAHHSAGDVTKRWAASLTRLRRRADLDHRRGRLHRHGARRRTAQRRARSHRARRRCCMTRPTARRSCARRGVKLVEGDIRDPEARANALRRTPKRSCIWPRSSATRPARSTRQLAQEVNVEASFALADAGGRRRALRDGQHLLELRADGRPDGADRRDRRARARVASTPSRRSRSSSTCSQTKPERRLPALRDRLRRRAADALRPDRQRVHPRPLGRPHARGLRRAVLASLRARPRRRARHPDGPGGPDGGGRRGLQHRRLARELPQARPRRAHPARRPTAARSSSSTATRTRATTRSLRQGRSASSATRSPRPSRTASPRCSRRSTRAASRTPSSAATATSRDGTGAPRGAPPVRPLSRTRAATGRVTSAPR